MDEHQGISLVGVKTTKPKPIKVAAPKKAVAKKPTASKTSGGPVTTKLVKPKVSSVAQIQPQKNAPSKKPSLKKKQNAKR